MPPKKPVTTKRGQYHKFKSFRINLVKDATLEKIDSNILRNKPEMFEKKQVMFEKRNADPLYFRETLCNEFPSLQGKEFSLWRLGCTNASKETKTSLIALPSEINNAAALCDCEELNRSRLYIKLQAAPASHPVPSPQPHSLQSGDEDDSSHTVSSSSKLNNVPDLLPTETNLIRSFPSPHPNHEYPVWTFIQTSDNNGDLQFQSLTTQSWQTVSATDINQPLETSVPFSQQLLTSQYCPEKDNQLLQMTSKAEVSSSRDTENRHPKKRRFPPEDAKNCEPTAYTDVNGSMRDVVDDLEAMRHTPNSQLMSFERAAVLDVGSQQPTALSYTALLNDHTPIPEIAQQARTMDIGYPYQIYLNPANEASNFRWMAGHNSSIEEPLTASLPTLLYNVPGTSVLQDSAVNSISTNAQTSWDQNTPIQTTEPLRINLGEVTATNDGSMTQVEVWTNLIMKHMEFLVDRMDPDFGLLDVLIASKDLTMAEFHQIRSQPSTIEDRNRKLLQYIVNKNKADKLTAALEKARQKHLVNYLYSDGEFREDYCEFWPLLENELEKLITNRQTLIDGLDLSYLSFKLYFKEVINKRQHEFILSKPTNSEKNEALLEMLRRGSMKQYNQTIDSLQELNQDRIANILRESGGDQMQVMMQHEGMEKEELTKQPEHERKEKELLHCIGSLHQFQKPRRISGEVQEKYKSDPVLIHMIRTRKKLSNEASAEGRENRQDNENDIVGLTILEKELFVLHRSSSEVEVYDSLKCIFSRQWNLKELIDPRDIASCKRNKCLYIHDFKNWHRSNEILRVDPDGKLIKRWSTKDDFGNGLSVTEDSNVILAVRDENKLNEYLPNGLFIREINLSPEAGVRHPHHSVKLTNGHFLVSHGYEDCEEHKVCIVDANGNLKKSFGGKHGSTIGQFHWPAYMAVDGNGFVMVADYLNSRVMLLDSDLKFRREILSEDETHGLQDPYKILLDESNSRLFVADNEHRNQRILIFDL